jgi:hypothetical protein
MNGKKGLFLAIVVLGLSGASVAQAASPAEQRLLDATNQVRSEQGLEPLRWDASLAEAARAHAELMVDQNQLSHQYPGEADLTARAGQAGAHFQAVAENVAMGPSANAIQKQWMQSTPHRNNILDPQMTTIGISVLEKRGYLYAVEDFANGVASLSGEQVEQKIGALLNEQNVAPTGPKRDARQTCEMQAGIAGDSHPGAVVRWEGPDVSKLPDVLEQRVRSGQYHTAAVGACTSARPGQGFTTYRVAVLLY